MSLALSTTPGKEYILRVTIPITGALQSISLGRLITGWAVGLKDGCLRESDEHCRWQR
jgi:hypothetical protein